MECWHTERGGFCPSCLWWRAVESLIPSLPLSTTTYSGSCSLGEEVDHNKKKKPKQLLHWLNITFIQLFLCAGSTFWLNTRGDCNLKKKSLDFIFTLKRPLWRYRGENVLSKALQYDFYFIWAKNCLENLWRYRSRRLRFWINEVYFFIWQFTYPVTGPV